MVAHVNADDPVMCEAVGNSHVGKPRYYELLYKLAAHLSLGAETRAAPLVSRNTEGHRGRWDTVPFRVPFCSEPASPAARCQQVNC